MGEEKSELPPKPTLTEISKRFVREWGKTLIINLSIVSCGAQAFLAGLNTAQGNRETALLHGFAAGGSAAAAALFHISNKEKN